MAVLVGRCSSNTAGAANARFSLLTDRSSTAIPTLYAAQDAATALMHTVLHDVSCPWAGFISRGTAQGIAVQPGPFSSSWAANREATQTSKTQAAPAGRVGAAPVRSKQEPVSIQSAAGFQRDQENLSSTREAVQEAGGQLTVHNRICSPNVPSPHKFPQESIQKVGNRLVANGHRSVPAQSPSSLADFLLQVRNAQRSFRPESVNAPNSRAARALRCLLRSICHLSARCAYSRVKYRRQKDGERMTSPMLCCSRYLAVENERGIAAVLPL